MTITCDHPEFSSTVAIAKMEDTGKVMAEVRIICSVCKLPFRFIGLPMGLSWDRPMIDVGGIELRAPIEPMPVDQFFLLSGQAGAA